MIFFEVDAPTTRTFSRGRYSPGTFDFVPDEIYVTSKWQMQKLLRLPDAGLDDGSITVADVREKIEGKKLPLNIGFGGLSGVLDALPHSKLTIGILNGMGRAFGDNIVGMTALRVFRDRIEKAFPLEIHLFQFNPEKIKPICTRDRTVDSTHPLPITLDKFLELDAFVDLTDKFDKLNRLPMVDWYLSAFSTDPDSVSGAEKRNKYRIDQSVGNEIARVFDEIRKDDRPVLLFHHLSHSKVRSMPEETAVHCVEEIMNSRNCTVVSAVSLPINHPDFVDLSSYSDTIDHFASIISNCDAFLSVDTACYHLADAFGIPGTVLFASIEPELRVKYYPKISGQLLCDRDSKIYGLNSEKKNLVQRKKQISIAKNVWNKWDMSRTLTELDTIMSGKNFVPGR